MSLRTPFRQVARVWRFWRGKPHMTISRFGSRTDNPKIVLGIAGGRPRWGWATTSLMTEPDTDQGNALIEMHARTLNKITAIPVLDRRHLHSLQPGGTRLERTT